MTLLSTGYKTMSFMSTGNTSMRFTSTGNGRSIALNNYKFALHIYGALLLPNIEVCSKFVQICNILGKFVILRYDKKFFIEYAKLAARIQQKSQVENLSKCSW